VPHFDCLQDLDVVLNLIQKQTKKVEPKLFNFSVRATMCHEAHTHRNVVLSFKHVHVHVLRVLQC
jgi:hypothetical protein